MTKDFLEVLGIVIRDQIIMKNSVEIKGLGTFKPVHHNQKQEKRTDGTNVMIPPKDTIEFTAENKG
ncbi:MAG: HU family DNA-binding protein [Gracilimonas sp.]|jgi:nucleoid DNA-binding protein|uniref:HU family DNA-binding protein n=1 Tax=Gracilimonas sp. TaxID=1974203 RepID=UPI0019A02140|nr:HU family DNA-binding protein [Gracilimonas sp.]MBD3617206.1 HU family DNA-binding protein [Gracilimonas sp.]